MNEKNRIAAHRQCIDTETKEMRTVYTIHSVSKESIRRDEHTIAVHPPAMAHPIRCLSQFRSPESQNLDWSIASVLSSGQVCAIVGRLETEL